MHGYGTHRTCLVGCCSLWNTALRARSSAETRVSPSRHSPPGTSNEKSRSSPRRQAEKLKARPSLQALNCIMEMVEKTRRSMAVLRRCQEADREELNYWKRRCSETAETRKAGSELVSRQHSPSSSDSIGSGKRCPRPRREWHVVPGFVGGWNAVRGKAFFFKNDLFKVVV